MVTASPIILQKLLFVSTELAVGGTERHLAAVLPELVAAGFDVTLVALRGGPLAGPLRAAGVKVIVGRDLPGPLRLIFGIGLVSTCILCDRAEVVHMFLPEAYLAGGIASLFIGRRIWVMSRRSRNNYLLRRPIAARLEHWLHRRMHALLGNSSAVCADLSAEGAPSARIGMLRNGMAIGGPRESREQTRARLNLVLDAPVLLVVANLLPYKGHADLLRAMALAVSALPEATVLLVAGADRGEGRALAALASAAGIERSCRWLGPRDDVAELMQAADVLIHPAHEEGSPNVVLEAMAAGLAVIATDVGGTAELLGEVGLLVPARDPTALAAAIIQLVTDQHLRTTLATSGRARASAEFSLEACVARYCALYAGLAVGAAPRDLLPWEHF